MNTTSKHIRIAGFLFSIVMSTTVIGATILSMSPALAVDTAQVIALEHVTITAPATN
jgi:hypothetical protein